MSTPGIKEFFSNKVTIRLKNGHRFEGLLSQINYKNQSVILEDVEDLGNQTDSNFIPLDKKIVEKVFQSENIEEILFKEKHFSEPKKYVKKDFWDAVSEPVAQQPKYKQKTYGDKNQKPYYKKNYYDNKDNRGGDNRRNYNKDGNNYRNNERNNQRNYERNNQRNYERNNERTNDNRRRQNPPREEENDRDFR